MFPFSSLDPSVKPIIDRSFFVTLKFALVGMWIVNFLSRFKCGVVWSGLMFFFFHNSKQSIVYFLCDRYDF